MNTTDNSIHTTDTNATRAVRRLATIAIVAGLALSFAAAFAAIAAETNVTADGVFAWIGDYLAAVGDALGGG